MGTRIERQWGASIGNGALELKHDRFKVLITKSGKKDLPYDARVSENGMDVCVINAPSLTLPKFLEILNRQIDTIEKS